MKKQVVMGIESTAHTFAVGIIDNDLNILADIREVTPPAPTLGLDPKTIAEHHASVAHRVLKTALKDGGLDLTEISAIAYSMGPGLGPALRIGATVARALSYKFNKPLFPVHHGLGHVELACMMLRLQDPVIVIVSGGHTAILSFNIDRWRTYGETLDITLGNLFDMFAREIGIAIPGGPKIEELAKKGSKFIDMPYTIKGNNVVYSGLLTYAIQLLKKENINDIAYSLQETAFTVLIEATERALTQVSKTELGIVGGVASNDRLYEMMTTMAKEHDVVVKRLDKKFNSDNGLQIAILGLLYLRSGYMPTPIDKAIVKQRIRIDEVKIPWRS